MKAKVIDTIKVGIGCTAVIFAASVMKYCLFAPAQIGQMVKLFN